MKSKLLSGVHLTALGVVLYCTIKVLLRRWFWGQIPTQIPAALVYAVLAVNSWLLWSRTRPYLRAARAGWTRTEKS